MSGSRTNEPKGVRLDHISKIYKNPKTGKDFYAVHDVDLNIEPGSFRLRKDDNAANDCRF